MERNTGLLSPRDLQVQNSENLRWQEILDRALQSREFEILRKKFEHIREKDRTAILAEHRNRGGMSTIIAIRYDLKQTDVSKLGPQSRRIATRFASKAVGMEFNKDGFMGVRFGHDGNWKNVAIGEETFRKVSYAFDRATYIPDLRYGRGAEAMQRKPKNSLTFHWLDSSFEN